MNCKEAESIVFTCSLSRIVIKRRVDSQIVAVHIVLSRVNHATVNLNYRGVKIFDPRTNFNVYDSNLNMYEHASD